ADMNKSLTEAERLVRELELTPHPEGGHYRETYRDASGSGGRAHSTAIYFLLQAGEVSRWHRVDAAEVWHYYKGAPLELKIRRRATVRNASCLVQISHAANARRWLYRHMHGRARARSAISHWSAARWLRDSNLRNSNWRKKSLIRAKAFSAPACAQAHVRWRGWTGGQRNSCWRRTSRGASCR